MYSITDDDVHHAEALAENYCRRVHIRMSNRELHETLLAAAHFGLVQAAQIYDHKRCGSFFGFAYKFIQWRVIDEFQFYMWSKSHRRFFDKLEFNAEIHEDSMNPSVYIERMMVLEKVEAFDPESYAYFAGHSSPTAAGHAHGHSKSWATRKFQRYVERVKQERF